MESAHKNYYDWKLLIVYLLRKQFIKLFCPMTLSCVCYFHMILLILLVKFVHSIQSDFISLSPFCLLNDYYDHCQQMTVINCSFENKQPVVTFHIYQSTQCQWEDIINSLIELWIPLLLVKPCHTQVVYLTYRISARSSLEHKHPLIWKYMSCIRIVSD